MKKVILALGLILLASVSMNAQRVCGSMEYLDIQLQQDDKRLEKMEAIERHTERFSAHPEERIVNGVITIPVVVHVVYNTSAENISDAQIQSQIDVLNADFRRLNADANNTWSQAQDSEIEFCMATVDPNGNATTGITRTSTNTTAFGTNDQVKSNSSGGKDAWDASKYMNMWVCDISGGILGYAQFPGGNPATDGVVIDYQYFGTIGTASAPFDLGRTATHEVGHYLNLRHIWGDGGCSVDDFVSDTPASDGPNYGCAPNTVSCGTTDMVQNYMDYSDDACMNLFTAGQNTRMRAIFDTGGARASLLSSAACGTPPPAATCSDGIQNGQETGVDCGGLSCSPCPCNGSNVTVSITLDNYPEETSWAITNTGGGTVASGGTYGSQPDGSTVNIDLCLADGCYDFTINDTYGDGICCSYGNGSYTVTGPEGTLASGGSFASTQTTTFCVGGGPAPTCTDGVQNGNETGVDCGGPDCPSCPPEPTCTDGVQNGNETGVDCGGPDCPSCPPVPTCTDGVQNGNETGVDCGGPDCPSCPPAPTCSDGVQNGNETGVDCGGPDCAPCGGGGCTYAVLNTNNFEGGFGIWNDGGSDCYRVNSSAYSYSGSRSVRIRDNTSSSNTTTDNLNLTAYEEVTIEFFFYAVSMENGEDFWLQVSTNGGSSYTTVASYARGTSFNNNTFYTDEVVIPGPFSSNTRFRFRCDASANNDKIYLDDITISGCVSGARELPVEVVSEEEVLRTSLSTLEMNLYPNPVDGVMNVSLDLDTEEDLVYTVLDMQGRVIKQVRASMAQGRNILEIDTQDMEQGQYIFLVHHAEGVMTKRFIVQH